MTTIKTSEFVQGAFVLVVALAWNTTAQILIDTIYPAKKDTVWASIIYSIFVTVAVSIFLFIYNKYNGS